MNQKDEEHETKIKSTRAKVQKYKHLVSKHRNDVILTGRL